jgi:hypothetical protein
MNFTDYLLFWLAQHVVGVLIFVGLVVLAVLIQLPEIIRQARCKHTGAIRETSKCDAICQQCGKNLGFIGTWLKARAARGNQP